MQYWLSDLGSCHNLASSHPPRRNRATSPPLGHHSRSTGTGFSEIHVLKAVQIPENKNIFSVSQATVLVNRLYNFLKLLYRYISPDMKQRTLVLLDKGCDVDEIVDYWMFRQRAPEWETSTKSPGAQIRQCFEDAIVS